MAFSRVRAYLKTRRATPDVPEDDLAELTAELQGDTHPTAEGHHLGRGGGGIIVDRGSTPDSSTATGGYGVVGGAIVNRVLSQSQRGGGGVDA